ncbi:MAG: acyl carrier protein [Gemmatimonadaceae bacterium]
MAMPLEQVVATALGVPVGAVTNELEFNSVPEWDSLNHVNLMLELESVYGVEIGEEQMVELSSVAAIRDFLRRARPGDAPAAASPTGA